MRYLLSEIAEITGGTLRGVDRCVERVVIDSRTPLGGADGGFGAASEALFVAIRTANRDGAAFIGELYARGVRAFLVGPRFDQASDYPEAGFIVVNETVTALQSLAAHHRRSFSGQVVAITGSTGKTTVKEWIAQLAPAGVTIFRSPKSWNSQIGVPLSLLMAAGSEDYIIIEVGISQPGEMAVLQHITQPDIGILTGVGGAHDENFESPDQLHAEKMLLFRDCATGPLTADGEDFMTRNAQLATNFWRSRGFAISDAQIAALEPVAMRLEVKEGINNSVIINDIYNSDAASFAIALDHLSRVAGDRKKIVIAPAGLYAIPSGLESYIEIGPQNSVDQTIAQLSRTELHDRAILIKGGSRLGFDRLSRALERRSHTTVLEVNLDAMIANLRLCRSRLPEGTGLTAMIKANGYGHGTFEVARTLTAQGVDYMAVAFADEGIALREAGITAPIVVLNADADSFEVMIRHRLEPEIYNSLSLSEFIALLKRHGEQNYPIHLKLDTGMHRLGFRAEDLETLIATLSQSSRYARVATIFSHLASADDPVQDDFTRSQIADFETLSSHITEAIPYPVRRHIANTKGAERFPEAIFDMVRLGIGLYGFGMEGAAPVATLRTRIVHIASHLAGTTIGYGRRGVLTKDSLIATVPIGYADGLNRRLSNGRWSMLVGGRLAPIVGNVCMDSCMIDVTDIPEAEIGAEATIFSPQKGNTAQDMADVLETIPYEVLTSVSNRVKRVYINEL